METVQKREVEKEDADLKEAIFTPLHKTSFKNLATQNQTEKPTIDLKAVYEVPVQISVVLGRASLPIKKILNLAPGGVVELDQKVGDTLEILVNNRLVARGEVILIEDSLGIRITEIIKTEKC